MHFLIKAQQEKASLSQHSQSRDESSLYQTQARSHAIPATQWSLRQNILVGPVYITSSPRPGHELVLLQPDANQWRKRSGCHTGIQHQGTTSSDSVKVSTWFSHTKL